MPESRITWITEEGSLLFIFDVLASLQDLRIIKKKFVNNSNITGD